MYELTSQASEENQYSELTTTNTLNRFKNDQANSNRQDIPNLSKSSVVKFKVLSVVIVIFFVFCVGIMSVYTAMMYYHLNELQMKMTSNNRQTISNDVNMTAFGQEVENILQRTIKNKNKDVNITAFGQEVENVLQRTLNNKIKDVNITAFAQEIENVLQRTLNDKNKEVSIIRCSYAGYKFDQYVQICYKIYQLKVDWEMANTYCRYDNGRLIILDNQMKFTRIRHIIGSDNNTVAFSVGVRYISLQNNFQWINGRHIESYTWGMNQPDNKSGIGEECGAIGMKWDGGPFRLHDISCTDISIPFICETLVF